MDARFRTGESFVQMIDSDHHQIALPLADLNFGLVSRFPLDYMHLVCLDAVRKVVFLWLFGPHRTRLQNNLVNQISSRLFSLKSHMPKDFAYQKLKCGRPQSIANFCHTLDQWCWMVNLNLHIIASFFYFLYPL